MTPLNELEKAVLKQMCLKASTDSLSLRKQLVEAVATSRRNTGAGFYTKLQTDQSANRVEAKVIGNVFANVAGLNHPMTFVLFMKDGVIDTLEGATTDEGTADVDFSDIQFKVF